MRFPHQKVSVHDLSAEVHAELHDSCRIRPFFSGLYQSLPKSGAWSVDAKADAKISL